MKRLIVLIALMLPLQAFTQGQTGYYRFPAIHDATIVFTSEGDLWKVDANGGAAQRLTTHHGMESRAAISPDGNLVAFSAQYEGPTEVYTMSINGGLPTRRTHDGESAGVVGWTPDGKIIYRTRHFSTLPNTQLATIDLQDNRIDRVPLHQASDGDYSPDGQTIFFTRLPFQGSSTKRYLGGTAQNLWRFTHGQSEARPLTADYAGTSKAAMSWNDRVYFASDRDGTMNLWSMDENGSDLAQHTYHSGWDVQSPDLAAGQIVYQLGADLHVYDIGGPQDRKLNIALTSDFDQTREKWVKNPLSYLTDSHISSDGEKLSLTARGRVFVAPVKDGRFVEVSRAQGVRFRNAQFLPNDEALILMSDASGEQEYWQYPVNGIGPGRQLTSDADVLRNEGSISPNGKVMAFTDRNNRLFLLEMASGKTTHLLTSEWGGYGFLTWSPDGKWLAYTASSPNTHNRIMIYSVASGAHTEITTDRVESQSPTWSPDGKWLYFLSDRNFRSLVGSPWGRLQPEPFFDKRTKLYVVSLQTGQRFPFKKNDELAAANGDKNSEPSKDDKKGKKDEGVAVTIDLEGIRTRVMEVPVSPGNYRALMAAEKRLIWLSTDTALPRQTHLMALDIDDAEGEPKTLVNDVRSYDMSADRKKLLVRQNDNFYVINASAGSSVKLGDHKVDLGSWSFSVSPREEWRQMFVDAWRLERDYFYDRNLHGIDWQGLLDRHLPVVDRVSDRAELNNLIEQLVGELAALHIYVRGGDRRTGDDNVAPASLGAVLERDQAAGGYRIQHIYRSEPEYLDRLAPLARADVDVSEGDIILEIDGVSVLSVAHPRILLKNKAGKQVLLKVKSGSTGNTAMTIVEPISPGRESNLRYDEWEYTRRLQVEEMGNGEIGYVHLRAMSGSNMSEWARNFYPVFDRKGLIIDVRHNRGGNIDSWILEKLMRKAWFYWQGRVGKPTWNMQYAFRGHMVVLVNERTASDGEAFAEGFRRLGLGEVIGTRTWGGEIWLSFNNRLVDGGIASAAQSGVYGPEGQWLIEGHGVDPDHVVDNLPHATFNGEDAQLEAAVKHLQELIRQDPREVPPPPPFPDKSHDYERRTNGRTGMN